MSETADLVVTLSRPVENQYLVELRYAQPEEQVEHTPQRGLARFDFSALRKAALDANAYGGLLSQAIFNEPKILEEFKIARVVTAKAGNLLRLRLVVDRSAADLHSLCWETLLDPQEGGFLANDQNILFSRFLSSPDWSRVELRARGELRALVIVANPLELNRASGFKLQTGPDTSLPLAPVDVASEVARARTALSDISLDLLASGIEASGRPTFQNLADQLAQCATPDSYDILYIVCHGALLPDDPDLPGSPQRPYLLLEKDDGHIERVDGERLASHLRSLPSLQRPRLIVLAACQSGGSGEIGPTVGNGDAYSGAQAALGPRLVEVGIPAVIAMQGGVQMATVADFMPHFFARLLEHGRVDQAVAAARRAVEGYRDWWAPVLYLRLREGRLWYMPSFAVSKAQLPDLWSALKNNIQMDRCVPVLGFGLLEFLAGTSQEIARRWAETFQFPLEPRDIESLPQVAQYLAVRQGPLFPRDQLLDYVRETLQQRFRQNLPETLDGLGPGELISAIGATRRSQDEREAHRVLASLPFSIYITANPDCLLEDALIERERTPQIRSFYWHRSLITPAAIEQSERDRRELKPTVGSPLVYHLFGSLAQEESLVLSEDDYFAYMMQIGNPAAPAPIPDLVLRAWQEKALLFLGFHLKDWSFRVLYRSLLTAERQAAPAKVKSVAVQLQPGDENMRPEIASEYLRQYFPNDRFNVYWGSAEDFLGELWSYWKRQGGTI